MHATPPMAGFFFVPLVVAASAGVVMGAAPRSTSPEAVEMEVLGVVPLESDTASLLVLRQKGSPVVLPIFVGRSEGAAIRQRLDKSPPARPLAADLLEKTIDALGGKVVRVEIQGAHAAIFRARVTLQQAERRLEVDARPSDSVALAMSTHAPIFATREVMAEAGLTRDDLERMHRLPTHGEEESAAPGAVTTF
jgi:bifunctional DNase/RNase